MKKDLSKLNEIQKYVTQQNGTEAPYDNEYWDFFGEGLYVDIVSGEVLFSSLHKFRSSCGWPAFYKSVEKNNILKVIDESIAVRRVEVRSKVGDSHLGHVFTDGPAPTGIRYCINSAALSFIPKEKLTEFNLSEYVSHFDDSKKNNDNPLVEFATLGAGCFWGVEAIFSKTNGIIDAVSGYAGGETLNPTYEDICTGKSGHAEVVQVQFDSRVIAYKEILKLFFKLHDPTTLNSQGYDVGSQYRSVIFSHTEKQSDEARKLILKLDGQGKYNSKIVTEVTEFQTFYPAEEYHQDYYDKKYKGGFGPICHYVREE